jgi:putative membrane protein
MKWMGFSAIGCALALTIACSDDGRSEGVGAGDEGRSAAVRPAPDDTVGTSGQTDRDHGATADARHFAEQADYAGNAEVKLGQLASGRTQNTQVKEFAQMMVRDHTKGNEDLQKAVSRFDVHLPDGLDNEHQRLYDRLSTLQGAEFDREYMKAMVGGHEKVASLLESRVNDHARADRARGTSGSTGGSVTQLDEAVTQWARNAQPRVEQHLAKAKQVLAAMEGGGGKK